MYANLCVAMIFLTFKWATVKLYLLLHLPCGQLKTAYVVKNIIIELRMPRDYNIDADKKIVPWHGILGGC